ncbi:putative uncharacterized protein CXorf58 homolog [Polypterus senegalus]|uniref:putative uncharacterized protein CXorf58 homolog n=1 Tax=Polypterus senegalus TaxID=55291 RepID=UPI0019654A81|nr:putative uncharacterized protein CXorf58 homolog [Polypterus senegalus]XP_039601524.1 putative uncharacterized protein CXorf58 homolog [Polypterus senegalus]
MTFKPNNAATKIQKCWRSYRDRRLFLLLKHTVCAAEHCLTYEILRKVSPTEAELLKDPSTKCKVRFRFAGAEFPPTIVFKIFHQNGGCGNKYINGKRAISPASEAAVDACKIMGHRRFYDQIICDEIQRQKKKIVDEVDVVSMKDYMQYTSNLDETPAYLGGKGNTWRKLSLEEMPRSTVMYDIVDYAKSGCLSESLREKLPLLLMKPTSEEMQLQQLRTISQPRSPPVPPSSVVSTLKSATSKHSSRRSCKARQKVAKMRKLYSSSCPRMEEKATLQLEAFIPTDMDTEKLEMDTYFDDELDEETNNLYSWTQQLSLEDTAIGF